MLLIHARKALSSSRTTLDWHSHALWTAFQSSVLGSVVLQGFTLSGNSFAIADTTTISTAVDGIHFLPHASNLRIGLIMCFYYVCIALSSLLSLILSSSCPEIIKGDISSDTFPNGQDLPSIYTTLISFPNVQTLDLYFNQGGYIIGDGPRCFEFSPGDRFPPLKYLSLDGYDFDNAESRWQQRLAHKRSTSYTVWNYLADMTHIDSLRPDEKSEEAPSASNIDQWKLAID